MDITTSCEAPSTRECHTLDITTILWWPTSARKTTVRKKQRRQQIHKKNTSSNQVGNPYVHASALHCVDDAEFRARCSQPPASHSAEVKQTAPAGQQPGRSSVTWLTTSIIRARRASAPLPFLLCDSALTGSDQRTADSEVRNEVESCQAKEEHCASNTDVHTVVCQVFLRVGAHICCTSLMRSTTLESHTGHSMQDACSICNHVSQSCLTPRVFVAADQRNSRVPQRGLHTATQPRPDIWVLTDVGSEPCLASTPAGPWCGTVSFQAKAGAWRERIIQRRLLVCARTQEAAHLAPEWTPQGNLLDPCIPLRTRCLEVVVHLQDGDPLEHLHELWPVEDVPRPHSRAKVRHRPLAQTQPPHAQARWAHLTTPYFGVHHWKVIFGLDCQIPQHRTRKGMVSGLGMEQKTTCIDGHCFTAPIHFCRPCSASPNQGLSEITRQTKLYARAVGILERPSTSLVFLAMWFPWAWRVR